VRLFHGAFSTKSFLQKYFHKKLSHKLTALFSRFVVEDAFDVVAGHAHVENPLGLCDECQAAGTELPV
jgi:hypothetical protein